MLNINPCKSKRAVVSQAPKIGTLVQSFTRSRVLTIWRGEAELPFVAVRPGAHVPTFCEDRKGYITQGKTQVIVTTASYCTYLGDVLVFEVLHTRAPGLL